MCDINRNIRPFCRYPRGGEIWRRCQLGRGHVDVRMTEEDDLVQFQVPAVVSEVFCQGPVMTWNVMLFFMIEYHVNNFILYTSEAMYDQLEPYVVCNHTSRRRDRSFQQSIH